MIRNPDFRLFLSYSNKDIKLAYKLKAGLQNYGIDLIYDENITEGGENWQELLTKALYNADGIIVLLTPNSISSQYVMNELGMARSLSLDPSNPKLLLPVVSGRVPIPEFIRDIQAIYWRQDTEVIDHIIKAVDNFKERGNNPNVNQETDNEGGDSSLNSGTKNHWLLKLNPQTWDIEKLKEGQDAFFNTYYLTTVRPEYELFININKGDLILCLAMGTYQSIVCEMEVTEPIGPDEKQDEVFRMKVTRQVNPRIPLKGFREKISQIISKLELDTKPPELFFKLDENTYNEILASKVDTNVSGKHSYEPFYMTEGDHQSTLDQLDFTNDINSFASVIALEKVKPPLAIGLFGNWGSGKSFFMEKLEKRIKKITNRKDPEYIENPEGLKYVEHVVHVKFNSWHYSDANLWASLITEIFDQLKAYGKDEKQESEINKLQRTLKTTILDRKVIDEKREELEKTVKELEVEQTQKRTKLEDISGIKLLKRILSDKRIRQDFAELNNENIEKVFENKEKIDQYISELQDTGNKAAFFFKEFFNLRGWRWAIVITVAIIAILFAPLLKNIFPAEWAAFALHIRTFTTVFAAILANIITTIKPYSSGLRDAMDRLQSIKKTMESRKQAENPVLTAQQSELNRLQKSLVKLDIEISDKKENINEILSGRRLIKFLDEKTKDSNYSSALGIISWVRKDFLTLDKLLREQHSISEKEKKELKELFNPEDVQLKIDRIILYIDDLDRCSEDVVVRVLEAIHLLLAFELFVVIVGVDPRWLNNALSEKYKNLFGYANNKDANNNNAKKAANQQSAEDNSTLKGSATSYDYLEKIFQIPFALKPINKTGREDLIQYLMSSEMAENKTTETTKKGASVKEKTKTGDTPSKPAPDVPAGEKNDPPEHNGTAEEKSVNAQKAKERLVFTPEELAYMQKISSLFGQTPRAINRYVNIYRIIKTHGSLKVEGDYSKDEFMPVMFLLGIIVGYAAFAEEFVAEISKADDKLKFKDFLAKADMNDKIKTLINPLSAEISTLSLATFKRNLELISRFSFRTLIKQI